MQCEIDAEMDGFCSTELSVKVLFEQRKKKQQAEYINAFYFSRTHTEQIELNFVLFTKLIIETNPNVRAMPYFDRL